MDINSKEYLTEFAGYNRLGKDVFSKNLYKKFSEIGNSITEHKSYVDIINELLYTLNFHVEFDENDLKKIPKDEAVIFISNYPLGGLEELLFYKYISANRTNTKVFGSSIFSNREIFNKSVLLNSFVSDFYGSCRLQKSFNNHLIEGKSVIIFPAESPAVFNITKPGFDDLIWNNELLQNLRNTHVKIIPVYFHISKAFYLYALTQLLPLLKSFNKIKKINTDNKIQIRIGNPIYDSEVETFSNSNYCRYLRVKTYSLGSKFEVNKFFKRIVSQQGGDRADVIIPPVPKDLLISDIYQLNDRNKILEYKQFNVFCAETKHIPNVIYEIGRLREETFRLVGEGSSRSVDLDFFDIYYEHLFIWDNLENEIVGAYRIGKGADIIKHYGIKGFYISSLFKFREEIEPILKQSIELGRSFICKRYQRQHLPLFLLWKGILMFLLKNEEYRYLTGPVSISNNYSRLSKSLIVEFMKLNHFDNSIAQYIKPKKKYKIAKNELPDIATLINQKSLNLTVLDKLVGDIESDLKIPVLLKKYLSLNAKIVGFNIDPKFNNCLDGLILLDVFDIPEEAVINLSKKYDTDKILNRISETAAK